MRKYVSSSSLNKTMSYLLDHPEMSDDDLNAYASDPQRLKSLSALKALRAIDYKKSYGDVHLYDFKILDEGTLYFFRKHEERVGFIKGFISGILISIFGTLGVTLIMKIITSIM